ncbi:MAG: polysaccharide biosynthesis/export family protein [Niabella sp.]
MKRNLLVILLMSILAISCTNYKRLTYFNNVSDSSSVYKNGEDIPLAVYNAVTIKIDDIISVIVTTIDPQTSIADAINLISQPPVRSAVSGNQSQTFNNNTQGFLVDKSGDIELPLLGTVHAEGLTTSGLRDLIKEKAKKYFKEPTVNVRLLNFRVTVLGEVVRPGTYSVSNERVSVLDALGLAGDLTVYGKRDNVMVIREINNTKKAVRMSLNDARIMSSPYFYLQQNDVVYVEPVKNKAIQSDASASRTISIVTGAASVLAVIVAALLR